MAINSFESHAVGESPGNPDPILQGISGQGK